jgi:hypothetical protein
MPPTDVVRSVAVRQLGLVGLVSFAGAMACASPAAPQEPVLPQRSIETGSRRAHTTASQTEAMDGMPAVPFGVAEDFRCSLVRQGAGALCSDSSSTPVECELNPAEGISCSRSQRPSPPYTAYVLGRGFLCVLSTASDVHCAGFLTIDGDSVPWPQVTGGVRTHSFDFARIEHSEGAVEMAAGWRHVCLRTEEGVVRCWGEGIDSVGPTSGSLDGALQIHVPEPITRLAGNQCGRGRAGLWCWGAPGSGRIATLSESHAQ